MIRTLQELSDADISFQKKKYPNNPYPVRTKFRDNTANELEKSLLAFFNCIGGMAERVKNMGREINVKTKHKCSVFGEVTQENRKFIPSTGRNGTSDVKALYRGVSYAVEAKIGRDSMSDSQKKYRQDFEKNGGVYIIARTFEQFTDDFYRSFIFKIMNIKEVFKKYPENEPNYNGIHYMCIIKISNNYMYSIEYYNDDAEWQLKEGITVEAFTDLEPKLVLNAI